MTIGVELKAVHMSETYDAADKALFRDTVRWVKQREEISDEDYSSIVRTKDLCHMAVDQRVRAIVAEASPCGLWVRTAVLQEPASQLVIRVL